MDRNIEQLRMNVQEIVWEYLNGQTDYPAWYPNLTPNQWYDYCVPEIYNRMVISQGMTRYAEGICDHLKFLGNQTIREVIVEVAGGEGLVA